MRGIRIGALALLLAACGRTDAPVVPPSADEAEQLNRAAAMLDDGVQANRGE